MITHEEGMAMNVHSANEPSEIGDDSKESSVYEALIIGGVWPEKEHGLSWNWTLDSL